LEDDVVHSALQNCCFTIFCGRCCEIGIFSIDSEANAAVISKPLQIAKKKDKLQSSIVCEGQTRRERTKGHQHRGVAAHPEKKTLKW
jgi:hypothetical protein